VNDDRTTEQSIAADYWERSSQEAGNLLEEKAEDESFGVDMRRSMRGEWVGGIRMDKCRIFLGISGKWHVFVPMNWSTHKFVSFREACVCAAGPHITIPYPFPVSSEA
jgi:cytoskeletal protein RodZ